MCVADSSGRGVLDALQAVEFTCREVKIEGITVAEFGLYQGCGNLGSSGFVEARADAAKVPDVKEARFCEGRDLVVV